jgi:glycosyltransferase involved in cell wall biosynthesis
VRAQSDTDKTIEFRELSKEDCGILLSEPRPEAFAEKLEVIDNPKVSLELKERNFHFAQARSWNKVAALFFDLYEELIDGR